MSVSAAPHPLRLASIDLAAIRHNLAAISSAAGDANVMAVVKANAYGHGAVPVALAAVSAGASWLGVADLAEASQLREAGITAPILAWLHDGATRFEQAILNDIDVGVSSLSQLHAVARAAAQVRMPARVHLKIDTGLGRNGAEESIWDALCSSAKEGESSGTIDVVGVFSHLSQTNDEEDQKQTVRFTDALDRARAAGLTPTVNHLAATAAALRKPETRFSLVRVGIGLYGLSPYPGISSEQLGLRPAMTVESRIIALKRVDAGVGVSYGYSYRTTAESTLALVALGFADGVPRLASNRASVWINGFCYPIVGRIAMDQLVVNMGEGKASIGDRVVLFGDPALGYPAAEEWAESAETLNYEIVTRLGRRIERRYLDE